MFFPGRNRLVIFSTALLLVLLCASLAPAQIDDVTGGEVDPIKLFERGQNAHAKGDLKTALALYEAAISLRPEFPEAEFQRGIALVGLHRPAEAEKSFRHTLELRKDWALPYSALGDLLARVARDEEAEPILRRALQLGANDFVTLEQLSVVCFRKGDKTEALALAKRATETADATASGWAWRGAIERSMRNNAEALLSLNHALLLEPNHLAARQERAESYAAAGDYEHAIDDLIAVRLARPDDKAIALRLAKFYELGGQPAEAERIYASFGEPTVAPTPQISGTINVAGTPEEIAAANSDDPTVARPALERLITRNPKNAALMARLGEVTRVNDPARSLECYAAANKIDPLNPKYAVGYAAALIQSRRFVEAVPILRRVIAAVPNEYPAHSNLAIALHELKQYAAALVELEWMISVQPERASTYFYIAIAHDNLGEYPQALDAYEKFLARADAAKNQLEIEKVNLRLPRLRDQMKRGQGVKPRKP